MRSTRKKPRSKDLEFNARLGALSRNKCGRGIHKTDEIEKLGCAACLMALESEANLLRTQVARLKADKATLVDLLLRTERTRQETLGNM